MMVLTISFASSLYKPLYAIPPSEIDTERLQKTSNSESGAMEFEKMPAESSIVPGTGDSITEEVTLPAGTPISLQLAQPLSSETATTGDPVNLRVAYDVKVKGKVVIPSGSMAQGTVVEAKRAKVYGAPGSISFTANRVMAVDGQQIPLSGTPTSKKGQSRRGLAIGCSVGLALVLFLIGGLLGLFIKGKNVEFPQGTTVNASTTMSVSVEVEDE